MFKTLANLSGYKAPGRERRRKDSEWSILEKVGRLGRQVLLIRWPKTEAHS